MKIQDDPDRFLRELIRVSLSNTDPKVCKTLRVGEDGEYRQENLPVGKDGFVHFDGPLRGKA